MLFELVVLMSTEFIILVKSLQSWLSHVFHCCGCSVAVRTPEPKRWVSLCTAHVLKVCIIVCVLSSLIIIEFVRVVAFFNMSCMKETHKCLFPIGTPNTLNSVMVPYIGSSLCVE